MVTARNDGRTSNNTVYQKENRFYYHSDHLGSAQLVTDFQGNTYERIEYTPYGESWIEWRDHQGGYETPFRFTAKERDAETGLYYYGARYMSPRESRWMSADPALSDYIPTAGADNSQLPGLGGIFNPINMHLYRYASNNPIRYTDPTGREDEVPETLPEEPTYKWPIQTGSLTSAAGTYDYQKSNGEYVQKNHNGIDVAAPEGTPVTSIADGKVKEVLNNTNGYGNSVVIEHADGVTSRYSHLKDTPTLKVGDEVKQGGAIGGVGNTTATGASTGNHLDFEVTVNGVKVDPFSVLGGLPSGITADIRPGYVQSNGSGGYQNKLLVPGGITSGILNVYGRSR